MAIRHVVLEAMTCFRMRPRSVPKQVRKEAGGLRRWIMKTRNSVELGISWTGGEEGRGACACRGGRREREARSQATPSRGRASTASSGGGEPENDLRGF